MMTNKEYQRQTDVFDEVKYQCSCGHKVVITKKYDKKLCKWCGRYVFKNKRDEFEYRLKQLGGK